MSVITVGRQTMVEPEEWLDELSAAVFGGGRSSKQIEADPIMVNLQD
ncbi:hypothetical protein ACWEQ8_02605 [Streptomyces noursei]